MSAAHPGAARPRLEPEGLGKLSFSTALRIAWRELRSSRGKFAFVVLSVAIGVGALTGVRGFSAAFRSLLEVRARSIMAADLSARSNQALTPEETAALGRFTASGRVEATPVTELLSMASASTSLDPLLVSLKAVDPSRYPFYGAVVLRPEIPLRQALTDTSVAVGDDLLLRLHLKLGDSIRLNDRLYRIAAVVEDEPDRLSGAFAAGPRVLISQHALEETGLLAPGSRATRRILVRLPGPAPGKAASDDALGQAKTALQNALPDTQVADYREANQGLTRALDGATGLLSLMSLVALVLGAIGVAMAIRAHLAQRLDSIAIMKALGAGSSQVIKIYLLQTVLLGLAGGVLGILLGFGVQLAMPLFLARLLHLAPSFHLDARALWLGLTAGVLTTLLFSLPPLLDIRGVRPILILRRAVEGAEDPFGQRFVRRLRGSGVQVGAFAVILLGLVLLASQIAASREIGSIFGLGLAAALVVLLGLAAALLALLRRLLDRYRFRLPSTLRHGLANLYRPGNPSAALLAALGLGVMQIATVYTVQHAVVSEISTTSLSKLPNLFLIDISPEEVAPVEALLAADPHVQGTPEVLPVIAGRITAVKGVPLDQLKLPQMRRRSFGNINLTYSLTSGKPPPGDRVFDGQWWTAAGEAEAAARQPLIALARSEAKFLQVKPGDHLRLTAQGRDLDATVAAVFEPDSQHAFSRASFVLPEPELRGLPAVWYGGVHAVPGTTAEVRRLLYRRFPSITVIDVAATVETVRQSVLQIVDVIQFLAAFSVFAGIVILASAIAGTRYRRVREVVVLKTLGATRPRIAAIFSLEFATLGLIAGLTGLLFANIAARLLLRRALHFDYHFQPGLMLAFWIGAGLLTTACGWLASFRVLGQKPLEVLREE